LIAYFTGKRQKIEMDPLYRTTYFSPIGLLEIVGTEAAVQSVNFVEEVGQVDQDLPAAVRACVEQLEAYFQGSQYDFSLDLAPIGTRFQQQVWQALQTIPGGETRTYGQVAEQIGRPNAFRAVGHANGRNPISIILPCHRLIGSDGKLTGYGGGLWRKAWLLQHEGVVLAGEVAQPGTSTVPGSS
jgi:methylated-DNA-[protein]-cysteine S-methyltransferase